MSDEKLPEDEPREGAQVVPFPAKKSDAMPPLTASDLEIVISRLCELTMLGLCEAHFHPCRFPLLYDAMLRFGAFTNPEDLAPKIEDVRVPIVLTSPRTGQPLTCDVVQWRPCDDETCTTCPRIKELGEHYPVPPEEKPDIWTPGDRN